MSEVAELAKSLGITDAQLARLHYKFRQEHGEEAEAKLLSWLRAQWEELRDRPRLPRAKLPGGKPPKVNPPFKRGTPRSGVSRQEPEREPAKPRRRPQPVKPPNLEEIKVAAEQSGYTENHYQALTGVDDEPTADEVANYRISREARLRHQTERMGEVGELVAAMQELRAAIDAMPEARKKRISKTLWTLRLRLDSAERELRRRIAA
jgi:hypothetical protein